MTVANVSNGNPIEPAWGNQVATDVNFLLSLVPAFVSQGVQRYANATARASGITSPALGQITVLTDTLRMEIWNGSAWVPIAGDMPRASARRSSGYPIGPGVLTALQWSSQEYDTANMYTALDSRIFAPYTGLYRVDFQVNFASAAGGVREAFIRHVGGARYGDQVESVNTATGVNLSGGCEIYMAASEYVEVLAFHDTGAGLGVLGPESYFRVRFVGPTF
jgi:hypothetical protein